MATTDTNRNDYYGLLAIQMDFVSRDAMRRAVEVCDADLSKSIGSVLIELGSLAPSRAALLETLVEEHFHVHRSSMDGDHRTLVASDDARSNLRDSLNQLLGLAPDLSEAQNDKKEADLYATVADLPAAPIPGSDDATWLEATEVDPNPALVTSFGDETEATEAGKGDFTRGNPHRIARSASNKNFRAHPSASPSSIPAIRYTILKHHAKGGLGDVYIARDEELNREVALKEIQEKHADRHDSRIRFLIEAEITGGLEHPGIVPVYGLGHYPDGRPFYAMRFIRGETLRDSLDRYHLAEENPARDPGERTLAYRSLLGCFVDVCNAIGYAHSRGVLHRDIKPGNIMLGKFGETLVVDWGLAKTVDHPEFVTDPAEKLLHPSSVTGSTPTMMGSAVGTVQYMSPEQAFGKLDQLGPGCDIYSLGATLYSILTGETAFPDPTVRVVLHKVQHGEFKPPREVNPRVPAALEAICLKAMAFKPEDRYHSTRELGQDVEHWLADEPVSVYQEPFTKRFARWARRHRQAVAGVVAVVITGIVSLLVSNVLIGQERDRTVLAKRESDEHYTLGRKTVETFLDEAAAIDLAEVPLMEPVRRRMLLSALAFYQDFLMTRNEDPSLRLDVVRAHVRLGDIHESLGEAKQAEESYDKAIIGFSSLPEALKSNIDFRRTLVSGEFGLGILMKKANRFREAGTMLRRSLATRELIATDARDANDRRQAALALYHLGALLARQKNRSPEDELLYRSALEKQRALLAELRGQGTSEVQRDLARNLNNLGILLRNSDPNAALASFREAFAAQVNLEKESPESPVARWQLARTATNIGGLYMLMGPEHATQASEHLHQALDRFKRLATDFPKIPDYRQELAAVEDNLSMLMLDEFYLLEASTDAVRMKEAETDFIKALALITNVVDLRESLVKEYSSRPDYTQSLGIALRHQAEMFVLDAGRKAGAEREQRLKEASAKIDRSISLQSDLLRRYADAREYDIELARSYNMAGSLAMRTNRMMDATQRFDQAIELFKKALELNPQSRSIRTELGQQHRALSAALLDLNRIDDALNSVEEAIDKLGDDPNELRRAAQQYAIGIGKLIEVKPIAPERLPRIEQLSRRCVEILRLAIKRGFADPRELENRIYAPIVGREDFENLKKEMAAKAKAPVG